MESAIASAWGRPPGWVQPRPTTTPSLTTMQPTDGLGRLSGRPRSASRAAAASQSASERGGLLLAVCNAAALRPLACFVAFDLALHRIDVEPSRPAERAVGVLGRFLARGLVGAQRVLLFLVGGVGGLDLRL